MEKFGNGSMILPINKRQHFRVYGGPYRTRPEFMVGVKMAEEIMDPCDVSIPTKDFHVPDKKMLMRGLLDSIDFLTDGKPMYVGCMGGMGRTGLFMAILAKAFGIRNPVEYVRKHYYAKAVETQDQYKFVKDFKITPTVYLRIRKARRKYWWRFWKKELNALSTH